MHEYANLPVTVSLSHEMQNSRKRMGKVTMFSSGIAIEIARDKHTTSLCGCVSVSKLA